MMYWQLLESIQAVSVASVECDQPRLRPMTLICMKQRLFLATGAKDSKVKQWQKNPKTECLLALKSEAGNGYLRIAGGLVVVQDLALKQMVADHAKFIYNYWQDPASPDYILYELIPHRVEIHGAGC